LVRAIRTRYEGEAAVRRGICLLNAGRFEEAVTAFVQAQQLGGDEPTLASYLAAAYLADGQVDEAIRPLHAALVGATGDHTSRIRLALTQWAAGERESAIETLREGIRLDSECAELHFQLGVLLCQIEYFEEAELRFTQAVNLDRHHTDAMVHLGLCVGLRGSATDAVVHLERAQSLRPHDARIGLLLAQAVAAARQQGLAMRVRASMFDTDLEGDRRGIDELSRIIEKDSDFVDAFLSIPIGDVDEHVFALLLRTLEAALERQPEQAELHYHCGRVWQRLGRNSEAIRVTERAVGIDPTFTRALIELAKLYQQTDRHEDATTRLEQAIEAGAEYADVYYLLGNLYRDRGELTRARSAYRQALDINGAYDEARQALAALPA